MEELGDILGQSFEHLIDQSVLTYLNWDLATECLSESVESLSAGLKSSHQKTFCIFLDIGSAMQNLGVRSGC